mgnify:FL=1
MSNNVRHVNPMQVDPSQSVASVTATTVQSNPNNVQTAAVVTATATTAGRAIMPMHEEEQDPILMRPHELDRLPLDRLRAVCSTIDNSRDWSASNAHRSTCMRIIAKHQEQREVLERMDESRLIALMGDNHLHHGEGMTKEGLVNTLLEHYDDVSKILAQRKYMERNGRINAQAAALAAKGVVTLPDNIAAAVAEANNRDRAMIVRGDKVYPNAASLARRGAPINKFGDLPRDPSGWTRTNLTTTKLSYLRDLMQYYDIPRSSHFCHLKTCVEAILAWRLSEPGLQHMEVKVRL